MRSLTLSLKDAYNSVNKAYALSKEEMIDKQELDLLIEQSSVFIEQAREFSKSL